MGFFDRFKKEQPKEKDWTRLFPKEMAEMFLGMIKNNPQACNYDEIPQGTGDFGICVTNPVPVYGIPNNEVYLSRLRTMSGDRITWRRTGSMEAANITNAIDCYEIFDVSGKTISDIYISPYHWKTSGKPATGFKIV